MVRSVPVLAGLFCILSFAFDRCPSFSFGCRPFPSFTLTSVVVVWCTELYSVFVPFLFSFGRHPLLSFPVVVCLGVVFTNSSAGTVPVASLTRSVGVWVKGSVDTFFVNKAARQQGSKASLPACLWRTEESKEDDINYISEHLFLSLIDRDGGVR